jgi:hypothetical protein
LFLLPEGLGGDDALAGTVAVQKLSARILAADLRALVADFISLCTYATTGYIPDHRNDPPDELAAFINASQPKWPLATRLWSSGSANTYAVKRTGNDMLGHVTLGWGEGVYPPPWLAGRQSALDWRRVSDGVGMPITSPVDESSCTPTILDLLV